MPINHIPIVAPPRQNTHTRNKSERIRLRFPINTLEYWKLSFTHTHTRTRTPNEKHRKKINFQEVEKTHKNIYTGP